MKTLIAILIIASFLQATILPLDLVLIILICRAFNKDESNDLFLAFAFGFFIAQLNGNLLGFISIFYLLTVYLTQLISKSRFAKNSYLFIPLSLLFLSLNTAAVSLFANQTIRFFPKVVIETILCIPAFYLLRTWEERFIVKKDIKLKV